jgi:type IV pilus assembly protein PilN
MSTATATRGALSKVGLAPATELDKSVGRRLAPIRINLLPHREVKRERRKKEFVSLAAIVALAGAAAVFAGGFAINQQVETQQDRNRFIKDESAKLDAQIAEIKTLRQEIAALRARQQAVENLQGDRTLPVRLFDELVRMTPEGVYLRVLRQDDLRVVLGGHAQTNERVAELLRNLSERSPWLERPELSEIKEITLPVVAGQKEGRKVFEFSLNALVKRAANPAEPKQGVPRTTGIAPAGQPAAASGPVIVGAAR